MEEVKNVTTERVKELIKDFPVKPYRNNLIITVNVADADGEVVLTNAQFAEEQYILALGDYFAKEGALTVGDKIILDLEKMMVFSSPDNNSHERIGRIKLKPIDVNGTMFAIISDNVILARDER